MSPRMTKCITCMISAVSSSMTREMWDHTPSVSRWKFQHCECRFQLYEGSTRKYCTVQTGFFFTHTSQRSTYSSTISILTMRLTWFIINNVSMQQAFKNNNKSLSASVEGTVVSKQQQLPQFDKVQQSGIFFFQGGLTVNLLCSLFFSTKLSGCTE